MFQFSTCGCRWDISCMGWQPPAYIYGLCFSIIPGLLPSTNKFFQSRLTYHKEARVGVDHLGLVAGLQIPEDRSVVEEGQVDHVLALLKLGWGNRRWISCIVIDTLGGLTLPTSACLWVNFSWPDLQLESSLWDLKIPTHCHNELFGEVRILGTNVGNFGTRLKETLPVSAGLGVWDKKQS